MKLHTCVLKINIRCFYSHLKTLGTKLKRKPTDPLYAGIQKSFDRLCLQYTYDMGFLSSAAGARSWEKKQSSKQYFSPSCPPSPSFILVRTHLTKSVYELGEMAISDVNCEWTVITCWVLT